MSEICAVIRRLWPIVIQTISGSVSTIIITEIVEYQSLLLSSIFSLLRETYVEENNILAGEFDFCVHRWYIIK